MCGITGILSSGSGATQLALGAMTASLQHRGPDDSGHWLDAKHGVALGHTRLSIVDRSASGHQPMVSGSERFVTLFNGEIYNHLALRAMLESERVSVKWRGHSDTETLTAGFDAWGIPKTLQRASGMFAIAVWDRQRAELSLARDRLGEKPLYYGTQGASLFFGSELKALRAHPAFVAQLDSSAVAGFLRVGYVPSPLSIYAGIHKLPPGTFVVARRGEPCSRPTAYWSLLQVVRQGQREPFAGNEDDAVDELERTLTKAVVAQQMSDVPLGAFLSGGVDSSLIVALMQAASTQRVRTVTMAFDNPTYNEAPHARAVAAHLGTEHTEVLVTPSDAQAVIESLPTLYDEPFADASQIPTFLVSKAARSQVTVALSGDAGDELFGGYNRYVRGRRLLALPRLLRQKMARGIGALRPEVWDRVYALAHPIMPSALRVQAPGEKAHKLAAILDAPSRAASYARLTSMWPHDVLPTAEVAGPSPVLDVWDSLSDLDCDEHRMMAIDAISYLPDDILCKVDRAAMGISLETRVPFLDPEVVAFAWRLPLHLKIRDGRGKWILRQLLYRHVPRALIERPKMGFGIPLGEWLRGPLRDWAEALLNEQLLDGTGLLSARPIRQLWSEHLAGIRNWQYPLWNVLMLQAWRARWPT